MHNSAIYVRILSVVVLATLLHVSPAHGDLPAGAKLLDDKTVMYMRPVPLVSPDGRRVAYLNRGFVSVADIEVGTTRRLAEVPGTWSHYFGSLGETDAGGDADTLGRLRNRDWYKKFREHVPAEVVEFQWTAESDAVIYGVRTYEAESQSTESRIWQAPLDAEPKLIARPQHPLASRRGPGGVLTKDGRFLVANHGGRHRALIWDLAANKPRATPFNYLAPSPTSARWLGVEKDTRELVLVKENFDVIRRYGEIMPEEEFGFDMIWSPDERFVFWRQQIGFDYYSNWVGCRYDLQTGNREIFTGDYMGETIVFTGNRGEFLRVGSAGVQRAWSGLDLVERYIGIVPDGQPYMRRFWYRRADAPGMNKERGLGGMVPVTWSPDFQLFTIGLPRQEGPQGEVIHLVDRQRQMWKLPGTDSGTYISPYSVAGFALDGQSIIAYDSTRLFAIPVSAIQTSVNRVR